MDRQLHSLRILPIDSLRILSEVSQNVVQELADDIASTGCLRNPIAVSRLASGEFAVLDGGARVKALEQLGAKDVLAQTVDLCDPLVSIGSWRHLVDRASMRQLREAAEGMGLAIRKGELSSTTDFGNCLGVTFRDGERFEIPLGCDGLVESNRRLRGLVSSYTIEKQPVRIGPTDSDGMSSIELAEAWEHSPSENSTSGINNGTVLVTIPHFGFPDLLYLVSINEQLPPHMIDVSFPRRYLGVNLTLKILTDDVPASIKNDFLDELLRMRLCSCRAAFYAQSVILMNG